MFAHLDDPEPYAPPPGLRSAVRRQVRRRRRRRAAVVGGVASVATLGLGSLAAVRQRLEPQRIDVGGLAEVPGEEQEVPVRPADEPRPDDPLTILVVGIDGHDRETDAIGLVRLDPEEGEVRLLSVPRDLVVRGSSPPGRINTVITQRGPAGLIDAIGSELGIEVHHYVQVDVAGAVELVDALGGIRVAVDRPIRDDGAGVELGAGCQVLHGDETLGLGRARRIEVQQADGSWQTDPSGVIGRDARGAVVAAALLQAAGRFGPGDLPGLIRTGLGSITVDEDLEPDDIEGWARDARDDRFVPMGLPVVDAILDGASVLRLGEGAAAVVAAFHDGGSGPVPPVLDGEPVPEGTGLRPC